MELSKKEKTIKYILYALVIVAAALLQNVFSFRFEICGARCFILIPAAVILSVNEDEKTAALIGLFAGVLWDAVSVQHMGFNFVFLMLACYTVSALVVFIFRGTFRYCLAASAITALAYCLIYWLLFVFIGGGEGKVIAFFAFYLPSAVYTSAVSAVVYALVNPLKNKLNKIEIIAD